MNTLENYVVLLNRIDNNFLKGFKSGVIMNKKCNKYEWLFMGKEDKFFNHLNECSDCRIEHEKMQRVSNLVKEAAPFIKRKKKSDFIAIKAVAGLLILSLALFVINNNSASNHWDKLALNSSQETLMVKNNSVITQMGLPTDEYGLLSIE